MSAPSSLPNVRGDRLAIAAIVATVAFITFSRTLLPGVDLGDTGGFQAAVIWPETSARQAYPLYYGLAAPFVHLVSATNPARGLNLFSAICGALTAGLLTWLVATIGQSMFGGIVAGLLLTFSYTFWTQAIIAEVYTLHLALVAVVLIALRGWEVRQSDRRLVVVCALYALAFGNHLSTILLLLPLAAFVATASGRPMRLLHPTLIASGLLIAAIGSLQYLPNLLALWSNIEAPSAWSDRLITFWFDVTKADWRATMLLGVPTGNLSNRLAMWVWDAGQQFGQAGLALAIFGATTLWWTARPWAVLVSLAYAVNTIFALTYNVGDTHVFFLPGHFLTALAAGAGAAFLVHHVPTAVSRAGAGRLNATLRTALVAVLLAYVGWRGWQTWPATDRHTDRRGAELAARVFFGVNDQNAVLVSRMNWDQENALLYAGRYLQPTVPWLRLYEVLPHFPYLVRDNFAIGRDVVLTADAAARVIAAYGSEFGVVQDDVPAAPPLADIVARIPRGAPYVLTVLSPLSEYPFDAADLDMALSTLAPRTSRQTGPYEVIAGLAGERPTLHESANRPFVRTFALAEDRITVRMDSWLPTDTFRRASFGHVLRGHARVMFVERGVSLVWFDRSDRPVVTYAGGLFAPQPRFRIAMPSSRLATLDVGRVLSDPPALLAK